MSNMGCGCVKAQVTAHKQRRRIRRGANRGNGFPKTLDCETVDGLFLTAPHLWHFALSSSFPALALPDPRQRAHPPLISNQIWENGTENGATKPRKVAAGASHDEEWVSSKMGEAELNGMVAAGVLLDRVTARWRPASGEPFPMPHTDEVVVFEDYF